MILNLDLDWLEGEEFYKVCQKYRHTPAQCPLEVMENFEELQNFIKQQIESQDTNYAKREKDK